MAKIALFFFFVVSAFAYDVGFTADFRMTAPAVPNSGYVLGSVAWRWSESSTALSGNRFLFQLSLRNTDNTISTELYQYDLYGGYKLPLGTQYKYSYDQACSPSCSTSGILGSPAMPPLHPSLNGAADLSITGGSDFFSTKPDLSSSAFTCELFIPRNASIVTQFRASKADGTYRICSFSLSEGCQTSGGSLITREFEITGNYVNYVGNPNAPSITPPSACVCSSALDIMIVIDRSLSITDTQLVSFHTFVINLLKSLDISETAVNVGIVWYHKRSGVQVGLTGPIGDKSAVAVQMSNCRYSTGGSPTYQIGDCNTPPGQTTPWDVPKEGDRAGTCTSSGVLFGSSLLFNSNRKVPKLLLTMTDGAQNLNVTSAWTSTAPWPYQTEVVNGQTLPKPPPCYDNAANGGNSGCYADGQNCSRQLKNVIVQVRSQYSSWLSSRSCSEAQCPLTLLAVGIGIPIGSPCPSGTDVNCNNNGYCTDTNSCLSPQHLDILGGGNGNWGNTNPNVLYANDFASLNQILPNLRALTCPTTPYSQCLCLASCSGFCSGPCNTCNPPTGCFDDDNLCYTIEKSGTECLQVPKAHGCTNKSCNCVDCVSQYCDSALAGGKGACAETVEKSPLVCPQVLNSDKTFCANSTCNTATGKCDTPVGLNCEAVCFVDSDCEDYNYCTRDICGTDGKCSSVDNSSVCTSSTDLNNECVVAQCNPNVGCVTSPRKSCDDNNVCTTDSCDPTVTGGCVNVPSEEVSRNCSRETRSDCDIPHCDPFRGCTIIGRTCNTSQNCSVGACDPYWNSTNRSHPPATKNATGPCYDVYVCGGALGLIVGLTAGIIAAIVIAAAFIACLILSGGTYALAQQKMSKDDAPVNKNPLYQGKGNCGENPMHNPHHGPHGHGPHGPK